MKNKIRAKQIHKSLKKRIEMARRSAFRMTPREEEVYLIVDGNSSRVCNLYAGDGTAYSVYITAEPSVLHTEPFFTIYNAAWPVYATHAVRLSVGAEDHTLPGKPCTGRAWSRLGDSPLLLQSALHLHKEKGKLQP